MKVIFFDLDGTLIDSELYWRQVGLRLLCSKNVLMPQEILEKQDIYSFRTTIMDFLKRPGYPEAVGMTYEECEQWCFDNMALLYRTVIPLKLHAAELVRYVRQRGWKTAIVTATKTTDAAAVLKRFGLEDCFDLIHSTFGQEEKKSSPALFHRLAAQLGATAGECMLVDDSRYALQGAKDAGCQAWAIADFVHRVKEERIRQTAHRYFETLADLEAALHEII